MGSKAEAGNEPLSVPCIEYSMADLVSDFMSNPGGVLEVGGSALPDEYPDVAPHGRFPRPVDEAAGSVALIGCSAGGYISRIYLSERAYGGGSYDGRRLVHSLVTLGTPHAAGSGVPFENVRWINREPLAPRVRALAVGSRGTPGTDNELTAGAYSFCSADGSGGEAMDGDGLTTASSALALDGAETLLLDGVTHYPWTSAPFADVLTPELARAYRQGKPWYGSPSVVSEWLEWLIAPWADSAVATGDVPTDGTPAGGKPAGEMPAGSMPASGTPARAASTAAGAARFVLAQCAASRDVEPASVVEAVRLLEVCNEADASGSSADMPRLLAAPDGTPSAWELVFSSSAAELPLLGQLWKGYLPNEEILRWDLARSELDLRIVLQPWLPAITIKGRDLVWDAGTSRLTYCVKEQGPPSTWQIIFADAQAGIIAARSSVTGVNVIKRRDTHETSV